MAIIKVYVPNNRAARYVNEKLMKLKGGIGKFIIILGDFNTHLSTTGTTKQ